MRPFEIEVKLTSGGFYSTVSILRAVLIIIIEQEEEARSLLF